MKELLKMLVVLTGISIAAGYLLATTNKITKEPIASARQKEKTAAIRKVLPDCDNDPAQSVCIIKDGAKEWKFYVARKQGAFVGAAFEASSEMGYSGTIRIMAGVLSGNNLNALEVVEQSETPGLGSRISESAFKDQFRGREIGKTRWAVKKDGGDIDAITGATISPRAVVAALKEGLDVYSRHSSEIASFETEPDKSNNSR